MHLLEQQPPKQWFSTLFIVLLLLGLADTGGAEAATVASLLEQLDAQAAEFEDDKDVKCWSSFGELETFVAGAQLTPLATHLKTELVINYLDQIWKRASEMQTEGQSVARASFDGVVEEIFPYEQIGFFDYRIAFGSRSVTIPYQDVDNYRGTVEPIRLLRTLTQRLAEREPARPALSREATESSLELIALLSTAILKEANQQAVENVHTDIQEQDLAAVDRQIAAAVGLAAFQPGSAPAPAGAVTGSSTDAIDEMLLIIHKKIESLGTFNREYTKNNLGQAYKSRLAKSETEWAGGVPLTQPAARFYKQETLVDRARFLYQETIRQHPGSSPISGSEMYRTLQSHYPFVTAFQGLTNLFPDADDSSNNWIPEYLADSFRDHAWHWKAIDIVLLDLREKGRPLVAMDLYAMEELSEFLSVYGVAVVQIAGARASKGNTQLVSIDEMQWASNLLRDNAVKHHAATNEISAVAVKGPDRKKGRAEVAASLRSVYIGELFSDVTKASGIAFEHANSEGYKKYRQSTSVGGRLAGKDEVPHIALGLEGGGVAVEDVDGDGLLDIYLVSGTRDRLYRNLGNLRFEDVTKASGLDHDRESKGAYFADYDNDGDPDLFVTGVHTPNRLFQNQGDGTFEDVSEQTGMPMRNDLHSHSATWFDYDNDGYVDLYIGNFGNWLGGARPGLHNSRNGQPNQLFRNRGDGTFEDVTDATHVGDVGWTHAVSHFDYNNDGYQDLYLANDFGIDKLLVNVDGKWFYEASVDSLRGQYLHGMSVGFTDVNQDGVEDVFVSNIAQFSFISKYIQPGEDTELLITRANMENARVIEDNMFLVSSEGGFEERHSDYFERTVSGAGWAWDADFFDFDNDGLEDLYVANGRENGLVYANERNVLYKQSNGYFYDVSSGSGADFPSNARGVVHADFDGDGDLDLIVNNLDDKAVLLRNNLQRHHWLALRLEGSTSNRDAIGARVWLHTKGPVQMRTVRGGSGYLSKEPRTLHFGLKNLESIEKIEILWPSGLRQSVTGLTVDRLHRIVEVADEAKRPLASTNP